MIKKYKFKKCVNNNIISIEEMLCLLNTPFEIVKQKYELEYIKNVTDDVGLSIAHYIYLSGNDKLIKLEDLYNVDFDFSKKSTSNIQRIISSEKEIEEIIISYGQNFSVIHLMSMNTSSYGDIKKLDDIDKKIINEKNINLEDGNGLTPLIYYLISLLKLKEGILLVESIKKLDYLLNFDNIKIECSGLNGNNLEEFLLRIREKDNDIYDKVNAVYQKNLLINTINSKIIQDNTYKFKIVKI